MFSINVETRSIFGKKLKESRKKGKIPAVLYGKGKETTPLFMDLKEFKKIWKVAEESAIIKLKNISSPDASEDAFIYDADIDPLKDEPIHVDFYVPEAGKLITARVAVVFEDVAPAVKDAGGVLVKVAHDFEVEALPKDFPRELKINLSKLVNIGDKILVKDIIVPLGVKILAKADSVVVLAKPHIEEKEEEKTMTIEDVEVAKKGKKEEEPVEEESKSETQQPKSKSK